MTTELKPTDNRKSFYGKCSVTREGDTSYLRSYQTVVASYDHKENKMNVKGYYSATTARYIRAFLYHFGFASATKKELENYNK